MSNTFFVVGKKQIFLKKKFNQKKNFNFIPLLLTNLLIEKAKKKQNSNVDDWQKSKHAENNKKSESKQTFDDSIFRTQGEKMISFSIYESEFFHVDVENYLIFSYKSWLLLFFSFNNKYSCSRIFP